MLHKLPKFTPILCLLYLSLLSPLFAYPLKVTEPVIRVLLYQGTGPVTLSSPAGWNAQLFNIPLIKGNGLPEQLYTISLKDNSLSITQPDGSELLTSQQEQLILTPQNPQIPLYLKNYPYHGWLTLHNRGNQVLIVNHLELSDYLNGVLPCEISLEFPEALKAQAIAARTYALSHLKPQTELFDFLPDTSSQVYAGARVEKTASNQAVKETRNLVLGFNGKLLDHPLFFSCCGGHTAAIEEAFWAEPVDYLPGVFCSFTEGKKNSPETPCPPLPPPPADAFCRECSLFNWQLSWTTRELEKNLAPLLKIKDFKLQDLKITERSNSGRAKSLKIITDQGEFLAEKDDIRRVLLINKENRSSILYSTLFDLEKTQNGFAARGRGWGHGVGLCQWGAMGMAQKGEDFYSILNHYYPNCQILPYPQILFP